MVARSNVTNVVARVAKKKSESMTKQRFAIDAA